MKIIIDMPDLPEGFQYTGEFRIPKKGEYYLNDDGIICLHMEGYGLGLRHIVRRSR